MPRLDQYISSAEKILRSYDGSIPLSHFLKGFFSSDKKYGSRDRKIITSLCFSFFRLGRAFEEKTLRERILTGIFLCNQKPLPEFSESIFPLAMETGRTLQTKMQMAGLDINHVFPFKSEFSPFLDTSAYTESFFIQPHLFLRIRPGREAFVLGKLKIAGHSFKIHHPFCVEMDNAVHLDGIVTINKDVAIQDLNSQHVLDFLDRLPQGEGARKVWDCCAASGGKAILAYDKLQGKIDLTVTDVRESIIANLKQRFLMAGIKGYKPRVHDLEKVTPSFGRFDLIICDVPCTGSGTWSRTPEQLAFFNPSSIESYRERQEKIVANSIKLLVPGGLFFYITCSVFKAENEEMVAHIEGHYDVEILEMKYLPGYLLHADTMFVAVFKGK